MQEFDDKKTIDRITITLTNPIKWGIHLQANHNGPRGWFKYPNQDEDIDSLSLEGMGLLRCFVSYCSRFNVISVELKNLLIHYRQALNLNVTSTLISLRDLNFISIKVISNAPQGAHQYAPQGAAKSWEKTGYIIHKHEDIDTNKVSLDHSQKKITSQAPILEQQALFSMSDTETLIKVCDEYIHSLITDEIEKLQGGITIKKKTRRVREPFAPDGAAHPSDARDINNSKISNAENQKLGQKHIEDALNELYQRHYPRKIGKSAGMKSLLNTVKTPDDLKLLELAMRNFSNLMIKEARKAEFIPYFSTFANQWRDYIEVTPFQAPRLEHFNLGDL